MMNETKFCRFHGLDASFCKRSLLPAQSMLELLRKMIKMMKMHRINRGICRSACLALLGAAWGSAQTASAPSSYLKQATVSQTAQTVNITANSPRPLEQTLDALHLKYGWAVNYEDPQYLAQQDVTESPATHLKVPAGGNFSVEFPAKDPAAKSSDTETLDTKSPDAKAPNAKADAKDPDEEKTLRLVLDAYNHSKNPGQFELRQNTQGNFYVVGTAARDAKGTIATQQPLLDVPLTIATEERTLSATIGLIFQAIEQQSHSTVKLGVSPRNILEHTSAKIGGTKISARELLQQCLLATHHNNMYWRLLFDPESKSYYLSIHIVHPVSPS
jgi:hypothetical protein